MNDEAVDYRIIYCGQIANFCYIKRTNKKDRFSLKNDFVSLGNVNEIFSNDELLKINLFCKTFEIDFAEIDILRDKNSKKIYIIDVNKTPIGPPLELNLFEKIKVITVSSSLFIKNFCN